MAESNAPITSARSARPLKIQLRALIGELVGQLASTNGRHHEEFTFTCASLRADAIS